MAHSLPWIHFPLSCTFFVWEDFIAKDQQKITLYKNKYSMYKKNYKYDRTKVVEKSHQQQSSPLSPDKIKQKYEL